MYAMLEDHCAMTEKCNRKVIMRRMQHTRCAKCLGNGGKKQKGKKSILLRGSMAVEMEVLGGVGHHVAGFVS